MTGDHAMSESVGTTSEPLNLFLAHSPFQYFVANHMVSRMPEFRQGGNYLVVDSVPSDVLADSAGWSEIIVCDPPVGGSVVGAGDRIRPVMQRIFNLVEPGRPIRLLLANVQWPLNNVLRGSLLRGRFRSSVEVCNYPEGIGSFRLVYPDGRQKLRDLAKYALGLATGVRYRPLHEDLMGLERSARIYSLLPRLLPAGLRSKAVTIPPFPVSPAEIDRRTCIFLGQNDHLLPTRLRLPAATAAAAYCRALPYERFLFKSHHYGESSSQREAFTGAGFEIMTDVRPVEQVLMAHPVACVVSFSSSALVHLKMMFGDQIRCVACFLDEFDQLSRLKRSPQHSIRAVFEQSGVELHSGKLKDVSR